MWFYRVKYLLTHLQVGWSARPKRVQNVPVFPLVMAVNRMEPKLDEQFVGTKSNSKTDLGMISTKQGPFSFVTEIAALPTDGLAAQTIVDMQIKLLDTSLQNVPSQPLINDYMAKLRSNRQRRKTRLTPY